MTQMLDFAHGHCMPLTGAFSLFSQFEAMQFAQFKGEEEDLVSGFRAALQDVPKARLEILKHTFDFLREVVRMSDLNRMNAQNVCRVFSATLLRGTDEMTSTLLRTPPSLMLLIAAPIPLTPCAGPFLIAATLTSF